MRTATPWNEERIQVLTELWEQGFTAKQIAERLGGVISRNAVIGKATRLGIKQPPRHLSPKAPRNRPRKKVLVPATHRQAINWGVTTVRSTNKQTATQDVAPKPRCIDIMELNGDTCRAVVGRNTKGLATYCGDRVMIGKSFCPGHCAQYYQPAMPRLR